MNKVSKRIIKHKMKPDGNCLFRAFAEFLFSDQEQHRQIRLKLVYKIISDWIVYESFVLRDNSYNTIITDSNSYKLHMSTNGTFGGEVEIAAFVSIYNVKVIVHQGSYNAREFGACNSRNKLVLLLSGSLDSGHYDILDLENMFLSGNDRNYWTMEKMRQKDRITNVSERRLTNNREKGRVVNMNDNENQIEKDIIVNNNEERLENMRETDTVVNSNEERVNNKSEENVMNMNEEMNDILKRDIKYEMKPDGNCLFRAFAEFVFNNQEKHRQIRLKLVNKIINDWIIYESFILGDSSYNTTITDPNSYKLNMYKNGSFGGEVEIAAFVSIYNVKVTVYQGYYNAREFGPCNSRNKLVLLLSGKLDSGHYDVLEIENTFFLKDYRNQYRRLHYAKNKNEINACRKNRYLDGDKLEKKRKLDRICNMNEERVNRKRQKDRITNMKEDRIESKREKDRVINMSEGRIGNKRQKDRVTNMSEGRLENKREKDRVTNMSEGRIEHKREKDRVMNMSQEKVEHKREKDRITNMNEKRLAKKRKLDIASNMSSKRIYKRRKIQKIRKMCPPNLNYVDSGNMDYVCSNCSAVFWEAEFSKKSCCHNGKVILPPLSEYNEDLKELLYDKKFKELIRYYNNKYSFASFNATVINNKNKGVYNLKIQGQVCHTSPKSVIVESNQHPQNGQIYIYDEYTANQLRLKNNKALLEEHFTILNRILNDNPYAKKYKHLYELSKNTQIPQYKLYFVRNLKLNQNVYNKPKTAECAAIIISREGEIPSSFDLCIYPRNPDNSTSHIFIHKLSHHLDPMVFPILFPSGDLGWNPDLNQNSKSYKRLTALQYYSNRIAYRPGPIFNPILCSGRLTQQYIIHAYIVIESTRMDYFRQNQGKLRVACYQGLLDHVGKNASNKSKNFENKERLGHLFILPSTHIGSPRHMHQLYQDAMAINRAVGRPDLFVTVTCNPNWPELKRVLSNFPKGTTCNDIPNLTARLFNTKLRAILADILSGNIFGEILAYIYTIEFQKRGLPHAHLLFVLNYENKLLNPQDIDKYVSAEIPNDDKELQALVIKHMLHGPHTENSLCYNKEKDVCSKNYPKEFSDFTHFDKNGFPQYKRRNNLNSYTYNSKVNGEIVKVDNSMVVPYNPTLLKKYQCHINCEISYSVMSIKYLYKYIHKGSDKAYVSVSKKNSGTDQCEIYDEITDYLNGRYVSPIEAAWRIEELPLSGRSHTIVRLAIHTENQQYIYFEENKEDEVLNKNNNTTLTAWFQLNLEDEEARKIKYSNIPKYYLFNSSKKVWQKRKLFSKSIGRMNSVSPKDIERFHLKLILNRVKGAICFADLKKYENVSYKTFKETAIAMGLVKNDNEIFNIFEEACSIMMPKEFRKFFAWFLINDNIPFACELWESFKKYFCEDFKDNQEHRALREIDEILKGENLSCSEFGLPTFNDLTYELSAHEKKIIIDEHKQLFQEHKNQLNNEQNDIFNFIIQTNDRMIFIDGPGGTGKTFLYKTLIHYYLGEGQKVVSMAWTGIASILLPEGMTSHRTFKLPLDLSNIETTFLKLDSDKRRLRECDVLIWDEASMIPKKALEVVDKTLRDCCQVDSIPFAGKLLILGGDFRQILPVLKNGCRITIINESIKRSNLWPKFKILKLTKNMRSNKIKFSKFLLEIGDGQVSSLSISEKWKVDNICEKIYGSTITDKEDLSDRAILSGHNQDIYHLNNEVLKRIDSTEKIYYSIDYAKPKGVDQSDEDVQLNYSIEYLNSLKFPGLPFHKLVLKPNAIVMLIRNISINDGLCNGTRLKILELHKYNIKAMIVTGYNKGQIAYIPKITLNSGESSSLPFILYRKQFPVVLAFAITINKSQGQSFNKLGIYFRRPLFSHGQLYVALSRCTNPENLFIENDSNHSDEIENIVWKEIFE